MKEALETDTLYGGADIDTIRAYASGSTNGHFTLTGNSLEGEGSDTIRDFEQALFYGDSRTNIIDTRQFTGKVWAFGGDGIDYIHGSEQDDVLSGEGDRDFIERLWR